MPEGARVMLMNHRPPGLLTSALPLPIYLVFLATVFFLTSCASRATHSPDVAPPALPPQWTSTASPTASLQPPPTTPTPHSTERPTSWLDPHLLPTAPPGVTQDQVTSAMEATYSGEYDTAARLWTEIIQNSPESPLGYFWRAYAYVLGAAPVGPQEDYAASAYAALEDIHRAIAFAGSPEGNALALRAEILGKIANLQTYRAESELLWDVAAKDLSNALRLGVSNPTAYRLYPIDLIHSGNCTQGYAAATRNLNSMGPYDSRSASNNMNLAFAAACLGRTAEAEQYMTEAMRIAPVHLRAYFRSLYLYALGDEENAAAVLNRCIEESPAFDGYRYYLRALMDYDNGDLALAEEDLFAGQMNTWETAGVASLVRGLLAKERGDRDMAIQELQLAEATISRLEMPLLERARKELALMGARPLNIVPAPSIQATPILPLSPEEPHVGTIATPVAMPATYLLKTGPIVLLPLGFQTYRFSPPDPAQVAETAWLKVEVDRKESDPPEDVNVFVWKPGDTVWVMYDLQGSVLDIPDPGRFVGPTGDVYLSAFNNSQSIAKLNAITVSAGVFLPDGSYQVLGGGQTDSSLLTASSPPTATASPIPPSMQGAKLEPGHSYAIPAVAPSPPFLLQAEESISFEFQWSEPVPQDWIEAAIQLLRPEGATQDAPTLMIDVETADGYHLVDGQPVWGRNVVPNLVLPPHPKDRLVVHLRNWGDSAILVQGIALTIKARSPDGVEQVIGWREHE
jgi:tetratricopeptide (TPR) repeat protein